MPRLAFIARCVDVALFASGLAYVALWGWPRTFWGWTWLSCAVLPLISWLVWLAVKPLIDARRARRTMAYRRAKFGGFIAMPRRGQNGREVKPVDRP